MIDMHTHLLPGIDDGAKTVEESLALIEEELAQGVKEIVFTPHYYCKQRTYEEFKSLREKAFAKIKNQIPQGLKVRLGAEVHLTGINDPSDNKLCDLAIENTKFVLIEFPYFTEIGKSLIERLEDFISSTEYTPIIAHVERYAYIRKTPALLSKLVDMGCLLQVNAEAFTDKKTKHFAFALLKKDLIHCLGSDAHNLQTRRPDFKQAQDIIKKAGLERQWEKLQERMQNLFYGNLVMLCDKRIHKFFKWYF